MDDETCLPGEVEGPWHDTIPRFENTCTPLTVALRGRSPLRWDEWWGVQVSDIRGEQSKQCEQLCRTRTENVGL
jgi:hypothetical protein